MEDNGRRSAGLAPTENVPTPQPPQGGGAPPSGSGGGPRLLADDAGLLPGMVLGKYQIVQRLGSGGMGSVYEAVHRDIAKPVALKTLATRLASEPNAQARFLREAASASRLTHPHVVDVTDYGSDGGITYLVMELLRGEDLAALVARSPAGLPVERIADVMLAVCAGVFAAHEVGVIHRDLKPPNIFLSRGSLSDEVPKVLDFGISKLLDEQMSQTLTGTGTVMGTTPYLSPEQVAGRSVDARSDQYALGVILYECATGRRPYDGDNIFAIMRSIAEGRFPRPRELRPDLSPAFEAVILRAMSHDPAPRYESVHVLGQALLPFASQRRRLIWSEYYGGSRGPTIADPMPQTAPLPELSGARVGAIAEPLDSTRTGGRRPSRNRSAAPDQSAALELRPRSRAPLVFVSLLLASAAAFGVYAYISSQKPRAVLRVERPEPRQPIDPPKPDPLPTPGPTTAKEKSVPPVDPPEAQPDQPAQPTGGKSPGGKSPKPHPRPTGGGRKPTNTTKPTNPPKPPPKPPEPTPKATPGIAPVLD